jgi:predicted nucleotidyltransferase
MTTPQSEELRRLAQNVANDLPPQVAEEVVLTGSVSRGMADEVSDIEMLIVTPSPMELEECFELARGAKLEDLGSWGPQGGPAQRVSGYREGVPLELIWWPREYAEAQIDALFAGNVTATADAMANGVSLRTGGLLAKWQRRLANYPEDLAAALIEDAAERWGGFTPAGLLTIIRPGERLSLIEWIFDGAMRVLTIVFAINRVWQPTTKRLAARVAPLAIKPGRLSERIEEALTERDLRRALQVMTQLQLDTVKLAPDGPNVNRARTWLADGVALLTSGASSSTNGKGL